MSWRENDGALCGIPGPRFNPWGGLVWPAEVDRSDVVARSAGNNRLGIPEPVSYVWRRGDAEREAEVAAMVKTARRKARWPL